MQSFAFRIYHYQNSCFVQLAFDNDHLAHLASQVLRAFCLTPGIINNNTLTAVISDEQVRSYGGLSYLNSAIQYLEEVIVGMRDPLPPAPLPVTQPVQETHDVQETNNIQEFDDFIDFDQPDYMMDSPNEWDLFDDDIY